MAQTHTYDVVREQYGLRSHPAQVHLQVLRPVQGQIRGTTFLRAGNPLKISVHNIDSTTQVQWVAPNGQTRKGLEVVK